MKFTENKGWNLYQVEVDPAKMRCVEVQHVFYIVAKGAMHAVCQAIPIITNLNNNNFHSSWIKQVVCLDTIIDSVALDPPTT